MGTYFNGRGRAETSRLVLAYAGVSYEDERITGEQLAALKPTLAYGQLPKLEYKGESLYQSVSIARFLAREFGIAGKTNLEKAQGDERVKEEKMKKVVGETIPTSFANLEKNLERRGGEFFVGDNFSWAELHLLQLVDLIVSMKSQKVLESTPKLANLIQRTKNVPNIKKYLEERPETEF